jgi:circadian clock protein KaiC
MIDSLRGYQLEMEQFGTPLAHINNLVHYLERQGVTSFLLNEIEHITGSLMATELGISHLADNIILLRYAEYAGQVIKVIACLKKRLGDFQPDLREFKITAQGILVGEKLQNLRGVLTGVPEYKD